MMLLKNATVFTENCRFEKTDIKIENGKITEAGTNLTDTKVMDLTGKYIIPGLVDIHTHGAVGTDTMDSDFDFEKWQKYLLSYGVTTFFPTTVSEFDGNICATLERLAKNDNVVGINLEGPYINVSKRGAHNEKTIRPADITEMKKYIDISGGKIKITTVAPEIPGNMEFIEELKADGRVVISAGHSAADSDTAIASFKAGVTNLTHTFNAMNGLLHREPTLVGAALATDGVTCEVISDGIHLHPLIVLMLYKTLGSDRMVLISDSMAATGLADGNYVLGGGSMEVIVKDSVARTPGGAIAGSTKNLMQMVRCAIEFGIPKEEAIKMASITPAKAVGIDKICGSISAGKAADIVICDEALNVINTFKDGNLVYKKSGA